MKKFAFVSAALVLACAGAAFGQALSKVGPSSQSFANGAGSGFGGTLGNGSVAFDASSGTNLNISFTAGSSLNDLVVIWLDTRNGGFKDSEMSDTADGGRRASSSPIANGNLNFPGGMSSYLAGAGGGTADFALVFASFGAVLFELNTGSLNFQIFNGGSSMSIPLSLLGNPNNVDWFAFYTSDSTFGSNESMPGSTFNGGGNLGFDGNASFDSFNRYTVPTPGALALLGLGGLAASRRRRA